MIKIFGRNTVVGVFIKQSSLISLVYKLGVIYQEKCKVMFLVSDGYDL